MAEPNTFTSALEGADLSAISDPRSPKPPQKKSVGPPRLDQVKPSDFSLDPFSEDDAEETTLESETPTPKAKVEPEKPKTYTHTPRQLNLARHYGIDDAATMLPVELLQEINAAQLEERALLLEEQRKALVKPADPKEDDGIDWGEIDTPDPETGMSVRRKAVEADFSPGLVKVMKDQQKVIKELLGKHDDLTKREQARVQQAQIEMIDAAFEEMNDSYGKFLGTTGVAEMDASDPKQAAMVKRRLAVINMSGVDFSKDSAKSVRRKLRAAAEELYGEPASAPSSDDDDEVLTLPAKKPAKIDPLEQRKKDWAEGGVKKPTHRNVDPKTGDKAALNFLKSKTEEIRGREVEAEAGLPDDLPD